MKYFFEDRSEEQMRKERLRKVYKKKRKGVSSPSILPDGFPINGTIEEKVDFWRAFNTNRPKWMN